MRYVFLIKHYSIIALVSNMEMWYGHDRKISEMTLLKNIFKLICEDNSAYPYTGYARIESRRYYGHGIQISKKEDNVRLCVYFFEAYEGFPAIFFVAEEREKNNKVIPSIFFSGSEIERLNFEIILEDCFFILKANEKGKLRFISDQIDYLQFFESILQKNGLIEPTQVSKVPG